MCATVKPLQFIPARGRKLHNDIVDRTADDIAIYPRKGAET